MEYSPELGVAVPELSWVPAPSFVLRRAAVLERMQHWAPGRVLEVGCGPGAILYELGRRGFHGVGVETSAEAHRVARRLLSDTAGFTVASALPDESERFDYLLAFEVLEHLEQDTDALAEWLRRLRPGGLALISVPAHADRWNVTDLLAGHFRRYDREDVERLAEGAGLEVLELTTYGWPATWLIERLRLLARTLELRKRGIDPKDLRRGDPVRTGASGVDRRLESRLFPLYASLPGRLAFRGAARLQRAFYSTDRGISYLLLGRRPGEGKA